LQVSGSGKTVVPGWSKRATQRSSGHTDPHRHPARTQIQRWPLLCVGVPQRAAQQRWLAMPACSATQLSWLLQLP